MSLRNYNHDTVLDMIDKCTEPARQILDESGKEEELDGSDDNDSSTSESDEEISEQ